MLEKFETLKRSYAEVADISSAAALLHWDQQVYMPRGGAAARARATSALEELSHRKFTSPETGALISALHDWAQGMGHDSFEASYLRAIKRDYDKAGAALHRAEQVRAVLYPRSGGRGDL